MSRWGIRTCREAALLLTQQQYDALPRHARLPLMLHLAVCGHCRRFGRQQRLISQATARWRAYSSPDEAAAPD